MQLTITTTNIDLTPAIQAYIEKKLEAITHILHEASDDMLLVHVEVGKPSQHHHSGDVFQAKVNVDFGTTVLRAISETTDLYAAIDLVKDEIMAQAVKYKDKHLAARRELRKEV